MTDDWAARAADALGIDSRVDEDDVLDLARVVAHSVERKMAPISTFLAGLAAGKAGGDDAAVRDAIQKLRALAEES